MPRCRIGSRWPTFRRIRSGVSCTDGQWRHQGRSCRIGSEQCAASTRRPARWYRPRRHHCRRKRQPLQPTATAPNPRHANELERNSAGATTQHAGASALSRSQLWLVTAVTTLTTYRRRRESRPSRIRYEVPSRATTLTGGAPIRSRTSATRRRTTGRVALLSITPTSLCSVKTPSNSTLPRANGCCW